MTDHCPTCGEPVRVVTEGTTSHYESVAETTLARVRAWAERGVADYRDGELKHTQFAFGFVSAESHVLSLLSEQDKEVSGGA